MTLLTLFKGALLVMIVSAAVAWFGLGIFCAMSLESLGGRYILQETGRLVVWVIVAASVWLLLSLLLPGIPKLLRSPKTFCVFVGWAALTGWYVANVALRLVNCVADPSEATGYGVGDRSAEDPPDGRRCDFRTVPRSYVQVRAGCVVRGRGRGQAFLRPHGASGARLGRVAMSDGEPRLFALNTACHMASLQAATTAPK